MGAGFAKARRLMSHKSPASSLIRHVICANDIVGWLTDLPAGLKNGNLPNIMGEASYSGCHFRDWVFPALLLLSASISSAATNEPLSKILMVRIGGDPIFGELTPQTNILKELKLAKPQRIEISFAPRDEIASQPIRFRAKLEGYNSQWKEAGGEMDFWVIFQGATNNILSFASFPMMGESEGWGGQIENSTFRERRARLQIPEGAERLKMFLISEERSVLGMAAVTGLEMIRTRENGEPRNIWPDPTFEKPPGEGQFEGPLYHWTRRGMKPNLALLVKLPVPALGNALAIKDDDVLSSAFWSADSGLGNYVKPGETLELRWKEAYSVGIGGRNRVTLDPVAPGEYTFRLQSLTAFGEPIGNEFTLGILIPGPWWKRPGFVVPVSLALTLGIAALVWITAHRRLQTRMQILESRRQMEHERVRIAQDIHDDLGASLTQISLVSQTVHEKLAPQNPVWRETERLRAMAVRLTQQLDEIVWAVNPQHDTLESLLSYLTDFAEEFLQAAGLRARIQIPVELPDWNLPSSLRHNIFLAAKEALNNAVRHAHATEVRLQLAIRDHGFELTIEDDGCGFASPPLNNHPAAPMDRHHGLPGMHNRMTAVGAAFKLDSAPGKGTRVTFLVSVKGTTEEPA